MPKGKLKTKYGGYKKLRKLKTNNKKVKGRGYVGGGRAYK